MLILTKIWDKLVNKRGNIRKTTGDFAVRQGLTQRPLAEVDFVGKIVQQIIIGYKRKYFSKVGHGVKWVGNFFSLL